MKINAAFVIHGELETLNEIENFINNTDAQIIYQTTSAGKLFIEEQQ